MRHFLTAFVLVVLWTFGRSDAIAEEPLREHIEAMEVDGKTKELFHIVARNPLRNRDVISHLNLERLRYYWPVRIARILIQFHIVADLDFQRGGRKYHLYILEAPDTDEPLTHLVLDEMQQVTSWGSLKGIGGEFRDAEILDRGPPDLLVKTKYDEYELQFRFILETTSLTWLGSRTHSPDPQLFPEKPVHQFEKMHREQWKSHLLRAVQKSFDNM